MKLAQAGPDQMTLHVQRMENDSWQPYLMTIEFGSGKILHEQKLARQVTSAPAEQVILNNAGIASRVTTLSDGRQALVPDLARSDPYAVQSLKFFDPSQPCYFPGCQELRKAWQADLSALPEDCPACAESDLQRRYMNKIREILATTNSR